MRFWLGLTALVAASAALASMAERWPSSPKRQNFGGVTHRTPEGWEQVSSLSNMAIR